MAAQNYTVQTVGSQNPPRDWNFTDKRTGEMVQMKEYLVKFAENPMLIVRFSKRANEQPPLTGDVVHGEIEPDQKYGPRFKSQRKPGYSGGGGGGFRGGGKQQVDNRYTMYLSYAKDIAVAIIAAGGGKFDQAQFDTAVQAVNAGGGTFFDSRKTSDEDEPKKPAAAPAAPQQPDVIPSDADMGQPVDLSEIPF